MKKIIIFSLVVICIVFISCGDSKKKQEPNEIKQIDTVREKQNIIGTEDIVSSENETKENLEVEFKQYTQVKIKNPYNEKLDIIADGKTLSTIPPQRTGKFNIGGDSIIIFKIGNKEHSKHIIKPNQKPEIKLKKIEASVTDSSLKSIQRTAGYKLEIIDDFPGQLKIEISGPVTYKKVGTSIFYITLNLLRSQKEFDNFTKEKEKPYKVSFKVKVEDKICPDHKIEENGEFLFNKW